MMLIVPPQLHHIIRSSGMHEARHQGRGYYPVDQLGNSSNVYD